MSLARRSLSLGRPQSLSIQLSNELTERIVRGELKPGDKLPSEHEMVRAYNVSRTVVREAVSSLKSAGLVEARQGVGVFVLPPETTPPFRIDASELDTVQEVLKLLELRLGLECEAAALAALRRTDAQLDVLRETLAQMTDSIAANEDAVDADFRFHHGIAQASNNHYYIELFSYLGNVAIPRARIGIYKGDLAARAAYLKRSNREHHAILQAIADQDAAAAREAMRLHLGNSSERLSAATRALPT